MSATVEIAPTRPMRSPRLSCRETSENSVWAPNDLLRPERAIMGVRLSRKPGRGKPSGKFVQLAAARIAHLPTLLDGSVEDEFVLRQPLCRQAEGRTCEG